MNGANGRSRIEAARFGPPKMDSMSGIIEQLGNFQVTIEAQLDLIDDKVWEIQSGAGVIPPLKMGDYTGQLSSCEPVLCIETSAKLLSAINAILRRSHH